METLVGFPCLTFGFCHLTTRFSVSLSTAFLLLPVLVYPPKMSESSIFLTLPLVGRNPSFLIALHAWS